MRALILVMLMVFANVSYSAVEVVQFEDTATQQRYKKLIDELRCLVCQNQNLADSNAPLAQDLRNEIVKMLEQGASDRQVVDFMVNRYGDFVLYRPPFKPSTFLLWLGPFIFLIAGLGIMLMLIRRRRIRQTAMLSSEERKRLQELLGKDDNDDGGAS
jgi:cytochrome c-type biogenesis protein CcmH